jgi:hypothetical protein
MESLGSTFENGADSSWSCRGSVSAERYDKSTSASSHCGDSKKFFELGGLVSSVVSVPVLVSVLVSVSLSSVKWNSKEAVEYGILPSSLDGAV